MNYKMMNNLLGWLTFLIALLVYSLTLEPSVSLWDCGEFISAADKLQVVHPPGAPFFLLVGRLFAMFASSPENVAIAVNMLSATASAFTVMFTFWITTHFAKKMVKNTQNKANAIAVFSSGIVAALALTFSDSFWFSAVEAEVYALSSFFTALTFWAALKWEESDKEDANKWLILIAYLIGLAIGTHLLNILVIPAVVFIYYFKNYQQVTRKGIIRSFFIGLMILLFVQKGIIPGIPKLMAMADMFFVNTLGMGFNKGVIFVLVFLIAGTTYGIYYFSKIKPRYFFHLGFLCFAYILLGYSSYTMVVVRSMDNPAIDMNNPEEPFNLLSYINREQYGDRPLLYGPYFNAGPVDENGDGYADVKEVSDVVRKDEDRYTVIGSRQEMIFDSKYSTLFPRMGDKDKASSEQGYRSWGGMDEISNDIFEVQNQMQRTQDPEQREELAEKLRTLKAVKPTMLNNLMFFINYQINHMYIRYFMWNFVGRQNDQQGHDWNKTIDGNWISGIKFIDAIFFGPQSDLPNYMENNKGRNKFYFIPLLLGILGIYYHYKKGKNDAIITGILFVFTGLLIVVYLNQPPYEPRERDYSLVGSFQTFCIWIGLGVLFIWDKLKNKMSGISAAALSLIIALSAPVLMGTQGWDDHDRSERYLAIDFAKNYLNSCPPNAVLFTNGDNDTYPLWYAQNVEGFRTDVRIINQSLLPTDWYSQVLLEKVYKSDTLPLSFTKEQLKIGNNDNFQFKDNKKAVPENLANFVKGLLNSNTKTFGTKRFRVLVDRDAVIKSNVVRAKDSLKIENYMFLNFTKNNMNKGDLILLDLIANNALTGWKRPICFSSTSGDEGFAGLEKYLVRKGLIYQLVPIKTEEAQKNYISMDKETTYDLLMNKYDYSGINKKKNFYLDDKATIVPATLQNMFVVLAGEYLTEADIIKQTDSMLTIPENKAKVEELNKKAIAILDKCLKVLPFDVLVTQSEIKFSMGVLYHDAGDAKKSEAMFNDVFEDCSQEIAYFVKFNGRKGIYLLKQKTKDAKDTIDRIIQYGKDWNYSSVQKWEKIEKDLSQPVMNFLQS
jgi:hypothetical protein